LRLDARRTREGTEGVWQAARCEFCEEGAAEALGCLVEVLIEVLDVLPHQLDQFFECVATEFGAGQTPNACHQNDGRSVHEEAERADLGEGWVAGRDALDAILEMTDHDLGHLERIGHKLKSKFVDGGGPHEIGAVFSGRNEPRVVDPADSVFECGVWTTEVVAVGLVSAVHDTRIGFGHTARRQEMQPRG